MDPNRSDCEAKLVDKISFNASLTQELKELADSGRKVDSVSIYKSEIPGPENIIAWSRADSREVGYTRENTTFYQAEYFNEQSKLTDFVTHLKLQNAYFIVNKMPPGSILPWHFDTYQRLRGKPLNIEEMEALRESDNIKRYLIFLEDWHWGHFLQIGNSVISNWRAGDVYTWSPFIYHLAVNAGITDRYTLTITGITE